MKKTIKGEKHFCSSVWILTNKSPKKVLLIYHKKLGKWQQPGGHIEQFENPVEAAIREIKEETGIDIKFLTKRVKKINEIDSFLPLPKFVIEQKIPKYKNCPVHYHLDLQFIIKIKEAKIDSNNNALGIGWFTKKEVLRLPIHEDTRIVIKQIL